MKVFANDIINMNKKLNFDFGKTENIVGKGENAGYQHFLLFLDCFEKPFSTGSLNIGVVQYKSAKSIY